MARGGSMLIRLLPVTTYTFSTLGNSGTVTIPLAQHIETLGFTEADFLMRYHSGGSIGATGATLAAAVLSDLWVADDPTATMTQTLVGTGSNIVGHGATFPVGQVITVGLAAGTALS